MNATDATGVDRTWILARTALTPIIWGTAYAVTTGLLPPDRPLLASAIRALPAGIILCALRRTRPTGAWWFRAAVLGVLNIAGFFWLLFVAAYALPGGVAAILTSCAPLVVVGLSPLVLRTSVRAAHLVAGCLAVAGVAALTLGPEAGVTPIGVAAGLGAALCMGLGTLLAKRWGQPAGVSSLTTTGWQLLAGGVVLAPAALVVEGLPPTLTAANVGGYAYLCLVGALLAYPIWFAGLRRLDAVTVSLVATLSPVTATVIEAFGGRAPGVLQLAGIAMVLAAIVLAQRGPSPSPSPGGATPRVPLRSPRSRACGAGQ